MSIIFVGALRKTSIRYKESVGYHCVECKRRIMKICRSSEFIVPVFGGFTLKCAPYNFNGPWLHVTWCDSDLLYRLIGVNVWIVHVNVTLLCRPGCVKCPFLALISWYVWSFLTTTEMKNILQNECHNSSTLHKYMSNHKYLISNDCIMGEFC